MGDLLLLAFIFLLAGVATVPIAARLGLGSVLGYLIAGIAISPLLRALEVDVITIQHFAEFGVVMMLFLIGLELEPRLLWQMRNRLLGLGGLQVGLTVALVTAAAIALGQPWTVALAIGLVLSLSSTAIVLQTLNEKGLMKSDGGQASFSVLLFQDIAVIPMLALLPLLAMPELADLAASTGHGHEAHGTEEHSPKLSLVAGLPGWQQALIILGAIAAIIVGGRLLTRPIFNYIGMAHLREIFLAGALLLVIGIDLLMTLVGLSPALGTFLAGVVLANSEYRHQLESDIDPFKGLLLGLFFITVGASVDFNLLYASLGPVIAMTLGLMLLKAAVLALLALIFKVRGADFWLVALGLAQAGEFGFVLLSFAVTSYVIPKELADQLLLVVALSMLLTPGLFILYDRLIAPRFMSRIDDRIDDDIPEGSIIIAGHGRFGGVVNRMLRSLGYEPTVVDYSSDQLKVLRTFGFRVYFGDATRPDLLHAAGIENAKMLVVAIDQRDQISELVRYVTENHPHVYILARAIDRQHVYELYAAGCRDIIRETFDSGVRMGRSAYEALGMSKEDAQRHADQFTEFDRHAIRTLADVYDPDTPIHENRAYVERAKQVMAEYDAILRGKREALTVSKSASNSDQSVEEATVDEIEREGKNG